jgi:hypothetical protein
MHGMTIVPVAAAPSFKQHSTAARPDQYLAGLRATRYPEPAYD